jgi:hypothetical protein
VPPGGQPGAPIAGDALLGAIDEMELLLSHATQAGKVIPVKRIEALVKAKRAARNGAIDEQLEIAFWHEFQELGQQLQPISVDSLKATSKGAEATGPQGFFGLSRRRSLASRAVRRYQIWSVVALLLLLVTQIYTIFGSNAVNDIEFLINEVDAELLKIDDLSGRAAAAVAEESVRLLDLIREADTRLNRMNDRLTASYELLVVWFPARFDVLDPQVAQDPTRLQIAQIILESLSKYLLPLLYGLLGACVYVLRTLSQEIKNLVYSVESDIRFQLRIYLGALAGLAIGWLITEQSAPGVLQTVTPIALAFLAGYSVELLFSAMDNIIDAFTKDSKKGSEAK